MEEYISDYEMATPINKWLFPIVKSNEELKQQILNFDESSYLRAIKEHHAYLGSYEKGSSTPLICTHIMDEINKS